MNNKFAEYMTLAIGMASLTYDENSWFTTTNKYKKKRKKTLKNRARKKLAKKSKKRNI